MKLGMGLGPLGAPGGDKIIKAAQEAENLGYDTICAIDFRYPDSVVT